MAPRSRRPTWWEAGDRLEAKGIEDPGLRALVAWGYATRGPPGDALAPRPFDAEQAPELIGTAVLFHYINRIVTVFVAGGRLPRNAARGWVRRLGALAMRPVTQQSIQPGPRVPDPAYRPAEAPSWCEPDARIANRFGAFQDELDTLASRHLTPEVRECVSARIESWQGGDPELGRGWLEPLVADLSAKHAAQARLALLAALAPDQIDVALIGAFREHEGSDTALLATMAWPSWVAALRIGGWLAFPDR